MIRFRARFFWRFKSGSGQSETVTSTLVPYGWVVEKGAEHRPREPGQRDGDGRHAARVLGKGHSSCPYSSDRGGIKKKNINVKVPIPFYRRKTFLWRLFQNGKYWIKNAIFLEHNNQNKLPLALYKEWKLLNKRHIPSVLHTHKWIFICKIKNKAMP